MNTKHTPGPWHVGMRPGPMIYGPKGEQIADMREANGEFDVFPFIEEKKCNAVFIVRACNAHYDLVAALESALEQIGQFTGWGKATDPDAEAVLADGRAALAKAKGE